MMSAIFWQVFNTVFPIFFIALVGYFYGKRKLSQKQSLSGLEFANQANIQVFAPALIFHALANQQFNAEPMGMLILGGLFIVLASGLIALPVSRLLGFNRRVWVPPIMFTNSGNLGIPLIVLALGPEMLPVAIVLFIIEMALHMSLGLFLLSRENSILKTLREPMILAAIAGILFYRFEIQIPGYLNFPLEMMGQVAVPLMLFSLGVRMAESGVHLSKLSISGAIATPVTGLLAALLFLGMVYVGDLAISTQQIAALILFAALPPAVMNYIISERYQISPPEVASLVVLGNVFSLISIPVTLILLHLTGLITS